MMNRKCFQNKTLMYTQWYSHVIIRLYIEFFTKHNSMGQH